MNYWLVKSEGDCYPISALRTDKKTAWTGIRNYQARNFMRDQMKVGDLVLFYHSNAEPSGVYGVAKVASKPHPDATATDPSNEHFDEKSVKNGNQWQCVDMAYVSTFSRPVSLGEIKIDPKLQGMLVAKTGQRLSVMPVSEAHFKRVVELGG